MYICELAPSCAFNAAAVLFIYLFHCILIMMLEMGFFTCLFKREKNPNQFVIVFFGMQIAALCRWGVVLRFPPEAASLLNSFKV